MLAASLIFGCFLSLALSALAADKCNGHAEYCSRIWSNVSHVGAHDSAFVGDLPTENQHLSVTAQLQAGVRFVQGQTHKNFLGTLEMCHTSCLEEDAGSLENYMTTVREFLDGNPNEVVMMLLVNGDNVAASMFDDALTSSSLKKYAFTPSSGSKILPIDQWPTLGAMIQAGTRLVLFLGMTHRPLGQILIFLTMLSLDAGADTTKFPHIMDEFSYFFETPYDTTDPAFPQCTLDRPAGASPEGRMYIVNHFLDINIG